MVQEPNTREVFAAAFRDRVVHHLLYNFLQPVFEPKFIYGSYACRNNKGIHASVADLQSCLLKITRNRSRTAYFIHLDIKAFFVALKKDILFALITKQVKNPEIIWLTKLIIFSDPVENFKMKGDKSLFAKIPYHKSLFHVPKTQGLPIGNLTSQFFANVYLNELDQFAKHRLKSKYYLRYVDDFLLLSTNKGQLIEWRDKIGSFLKERLELEIHPNKQILEATNKDIDWLGYIIKPNCVLVRKRSVKVFKRKLFRFNQILAKYPASADQTGQLLLPFPEDLPPLELLEKILATVNSYFGLFLHADSYNLKKHLWDKHFCLLQKYLEPADSGFSSFRKKSGIAAKTSASR